MRSSIRFLAGLFLAVLLCATFGNGDAWATREAHTVKLYKSDGPGRLNPYTRFYDIRLSHEGLIKATLTIDDFGASGVRQNVGFLIGQKTSPDRHIQFKQSRTFIAEPGSYVVSKTVDSVLLNRSKKFRIILANYMNIPVRGKLVIEYPGRRNAGQAGSAGQSQAHRKCDLVVTGLALTSDGRVMVDLKNAGPGRVPNQVWTSQKSASVMLFREGRRWGGASIKVIDPQRRLQKPGGRATYVSSLKVVGSKEITAVVDYGNRVGEVDKANNGKSVTLGAQTLKPARVQPKTIKK